jgi:hypothetical protein
VQINPELYYEIPHFYLFIRPNNSRLQELNIINPAKANLLLLSHGLPTRTASFTYSAIGLINSPSQPIYLHHVIVPIAFIDLEPNHFNIMLPLYLSIWILKNVGILIWMWLRPQAILYRLGFSFMGFLLILCCFYVFFIESFRKKVSENEPL